MNCTVLLATNLNHTSSFAAPAFPAHCTKDCVAYNPSPYTGVHVALGVTEIAPVQSSLITGLTTQVLKVIVSGLLAIAALSKTR